MAIYDFFVSRNGAVANAASYIGHAGRLFYDSSNGVVKLSDGTTPGGTPIPYTIATTTIVGGIKAGPGANVGVDGTLTIDTTGLPLGIGNLQIIDTILKTVNANDDLLLESNGTGNVSLVGNILFHPTNGPTLADPYFLASSDGQITIYVPATDPLAGAVKIIGSATGRVFPPVNTGVMLHVVGNNNDASRIYNDGLGSFAAFVGRRINGNIGAPSAVLAGDEIIRISSTGYNGNTIPGAGSARIVYQAKENYTTSVQGTNLSIWTTAVGSNVLVKTATFDRETGVAVNGNLTVSGNIVGNATTTNATINSLTAGNITVGTSGTVTTPRVVFNDGGVRSISGGTAATIDFAADSLVLWYVPSGTATVTLSNYRAGAVVRLHIRIGGTSRDINYGVAAADNSSTGSTSFNGSGGGAIDISNSTMQLVYTCYDGTAANTYVAVTTV